MDTPSSPEYGVHRSEDGQPVPDNDGHRPGPEEDVHRFSSVVPSDLEERRTTDTPTRANKEIHGPRESFPDAGTVASEIGEGAQAPDHLGEEIPGRQDSGGSALGDDPYLEVDDRRPSDRADVAESGSEVPRHDLDVHASGADLDDDVDEAPEPGIDFDSAFG